MTVNRQGPADTVPRCSGERAVTIGGHHGCLRQGPEVSGGRDLELAVPGGWLDIAVDAAHVSTYTDDDLRKIAESVTLAKIDQPSTWFDAVNAIPR